MRGAGPAPLGGHPALRRPHRAAHQRLPDRGRCRPHLGGHPRRGPHLLRRGVLLRGAGSRRDLPAPPAGPGPRPHQGVPGRPPDVGPGPGGGGLGDPPGPPVAHPGSGRGARDGRADPGRQAQRGQRRQQQPPSPRALRSPMSSSEIMVPLGRALPDYEIVVTQDTVRGPHGPQGLQGEPGEPGAPGIDGPPGADGPQGPRGPAGDLSQVTADTLYVNVTGDTMTGPLSVEGDWPQVRVVAADLNPSYEAFVVVDTAENPTAIIQGDGDASFQNLNVTGAVQAGSLAYAGQDTDARYVNASGNETMTGWLGLANNSHFLSLGGIVALQFVDDGNDW